MVSLWRLPLEYDEAFNFTVVKNLAERWYYGSYGAVWGGGTSVPFDPYITTGPTVIVPTALIWAATNGTLWVARLVPVAFFGAYIGGVWMLAKRHVDRWQRLGMIGLPLAFISPIAFEQAAFAPSRLLGETAAAALIMWGLILTSRMQMWWGGLMFGLAIQSKIVAIAPAGVVALALLLAMRPCTKCVKLRNVVPWLVGVTLPTACFEACRMLALGWTGYLNNTRHVVAYSRSVLQVGDDDSYDAMSKLASLGNMTSASVFAALTILITFAIATAIATGSAARGTSDDHIERGESVGVFNPLAVSTISGSASLLLWILFIQETSGRQAVLGSLLVLPGLFIFTTKSVPVYGLRESHARLFTPFVVILMTLLIVVDQGRSTILRLYNDSVLAEQRHVAEAIVDAGATSLDVDGWWQHPEFQVLTDLPVESAENPAELLIFDRIQANYLFGLPDLTNFRSTQLFHDKCAEVVYESPNYVLCRPS